MMGGDWRQKIKGDKKELRPLLPWCFLPRLSVSLKLMGHTDLSRIGGLSLVLLERFVRFEQSTSLFSHNGINDKRMSVVCKLGSDIPRWGLVRVGDFFFPSVFTLQWAFPIG